MAIRFDLVRTNAGARLGRLHTPHGTVETPVFMAVGTQATVKGLTPAQLEDAGVQVVLGNTYHLALRPGDELIAELGGLHRFMGWSRPLLTDSGGYQVYSLAASRQIDDRAAVFRSHIDGDMFELTPERAIQIQENLGSDIAMCLDECPPSDSDPAIGREAVRRTIHWAERRKAAHRRPDQALFAIVQGGTDVELRAQCAAALTQLDFPGYALGGFSVGETAAQMVAVLEPAAAALPADRPRYLMGVGRPEDILAAVARGIDMFDCVLPTRNGRNAMAFTAAGPLRLRNARHKRDPAPLESGCPCATCRTWSRAYLHHLFLAEEMLGPTLLSLHNVTFYSRLMADIRQAIAEGRFADFCTVSLARWGEDFNIPSFAAMLPMSMYNFGLSLLAVADAAKPDGEAPSFLEGIVGSPLPMLVLLFVAAWFLLIRPARVKERQQRDMLNNNLKKNDRVITNSGIIGTVANIKDEEVMLKLEEGKMRILKSTIARILGDEQAKESKEPAKNP